MPARSAPLIPSLADERNAATVFRPFDSSLGFGRELSLRIPPHWCIGRCHGLARGDPQDAAPASSLRRPHGLGPAQTFRDRSAQDRAEGFFLVRGRAAQVFDRLGAFLNQLAGLIDQCRSNCFVAQ